MPASCRPASSLRCVTILTCASACGNHAWTTAVSTVLQEPHFASACVHRPMRAPIRCTLLHQFRGLYCAIRVNYGYSKYPLMSFTGPQTIEAVRKAVQSKATQQAAQCASGKQSGAHSRHSGYSDSHCRYQGNHYHARQYGHEHRCTGALGRKQVQRQSSGIPADTARALA